MMACLRACQCTVCDGMIRGVRYDDRVFVWLDKGSTNVVTGSV
jgi:hypothetical protein